MYRSVQLRLCFDSDHFTGLESDRTLGGAHDTVPHLSDEGDRGMFPSVVVFCIGRRVDGARRHVCGAKVAGHIIFARFVASMSCTIASIGRLRLQLGVGGSSGGATSLNARRGRRKLLQPGYHVVHLSSVGEKVCDGGECG